MVSALNERSVVMGTESSPTASPLTVSENQLSAHTSAVNATGSDPPASAPAVVEAPAGSTVVTAASVVALAASPSLVEDEHAAASRASAAPRAGRTVRGRMGRDVRAVT